MTVFDPTALHHLVDDARERSFVLEMLGTFRRMLERRVGRVVAAVLAADIDEGMDAVLSLKVSATMTGARELAELASYIEAHLRTSDFPSAHAHASTLLAASHRAQVAIDAYLVRMAESDAAV
jgi:HPt (histidine-containing phosphotransfer) domain-containing protein